jgi:hypothetical protein
MRLSKDRKTGYEEKSIVEADAPLMLDRLPKPERQITALTQIKHPSKRRRA